MKGPCICGKPGEWQLGLSWMCEPCNRTAMMDPLDEKRRDRGDEYEAEERAERESEWRNA